MHSWTFTYKHTVWIIESGKNWKEKIEIKGKDLQRDCLFMLAVYDIFEPYLNALVHSGFFIESTQCGCTFFNFEKKFPLHCLILVCTFIDFEKKFPPVRLFCPARLMFFKNFPSCMFILSYTSIWYIRVHWYCYLININISLLELTITRNSKSMEAWKCYLNREKNQNCVKKAQKVDFRILLGPFWDLKLHCK